MITVAPELLERNGIRLEPMTYEHAAALSAAVGDGRLWELFFTGVPSPDGAEAYIADALKGQSEGHMLPWVVRDLTNGDIIGSTRYHDIVANIDRVEIGYTWYRRSRQRTHVRNDLQAAAARLRVRHARL